MSVVKGKIHATTRVEELMNVVAISRLYVECLVTEDKIRVLWLE